MNKSMLTGISLIGATLATLGGCAKHDSGMQPAASQGDEATPAENAKGDTMATPSDGQIAKILETVDSGEIAQAQVALTKATDSRVKEFAAEMVRQHTESKQQGAQLVTQAGLTPASSALSKKLESGGANVLDSLNKADASNFDATYMKAQIQQHQDVLDLISTQLIPAAKNGALQAQLGAAQTMVQHHLTEAQQITQTVTPEPVR
jgi:putative membrane protein